MNPRIFVAFVLLYIGALLTPCQAQQSAIPASVYSVKFLCGFSSVPVDPSVLPSEPPVKPGNYATAINIHNFHTFNESLCKKAVLAPPEGCLTTSQPTPSCFPPVIGKFVPVTLHPDQAFEVDCNDIVSLLRPSLPAGTTLPSFIKGFVEIVVPSSNPAGTAPPINPLSVTGVYTAQGCENVPIGQKCRALGGIAEEVVPQNSFNGELPPNCG
jgi:hypothetical protein